VVALEGGGGEKKEKIKEKTLVSTLQRRQCVSIREFSLLMFYREKLCCPVIVTPLQRASMVEKRRVS
jgi:hypothetical protein